MEVAEMFEHDRDPGTARSDKGQREEPPQHRAEATALLTGLQGTALCHGNNSAGDQWDLH